MRRVLALVILAAAGSAPAGSAPDAVAGCNPNLAWQDRYPVWGPSEAIAFQREEVGCGNAPEDVELVSPGSEARFVERGLQPALSRDGQLAYTSWEDGRLVVGSRALAGGSAPAWSPDAGLVAYLLDNGLRLAAADGSTERRLGDAVQTAGFTEAHVTTPVWSPDGSRIAFVGPGVTIWTVRPDGSDLRRVTSGPGREVSPSWSPDSSRIAFAGDRDGDFDIYVVNADGTGLARLTRDAASETLPVFSPVAERIAFLRVVPGTYGKAELWVMDVDGERESPIGYDAHGFSQPAWSPDGKRIVFSAGHECLRWGLYLVSAAGGSPTRITNRCRFAGTPGPDRLRGSPFLDFMFGLGGDDRLDGGPGTDRLDGGAGADRLDGGWDRDMISGGAGEDVIVGGRGFDSIVPGPQRDLVLAGPGNDRIDGRDGWRDVITCGAGRDDVLADRLDVVAPDCERVARM